MWESEGYVSAHSPKLIKSVCSSFCFSNFFLGDPVSHFYSRGCFSIFCPRFCLIDPIHWRSSVCSHFFFGLVMPNFSFPICFPFPGLIDPILPYWGRKEGAWSAPPSFSALANSTEFAFPDDPFSSCFPVMCPFCFVPKHLWYYTSSDPFSKHACISTIFTGLPPMAFFSPLKLGPYSQKSDFELKEGTRWKMSRFPRVSALNKIPKLESILFFTFLEAKKTPHSCSQKKMNSKSFPLGAIW